MFVESWNMLLEQFLLYLIFNPPGIARSFFIWVDSVDIPTPLCVFLFLIAVEEQF